MGNFPDEPDFLTPDQIQRIAETILGQDAHKVDRRGWATFWCPFHPDRSGEGTGGRPNFGLNLDQGNWNCFRCSASGPSLWKLADELNQNVPDEYFEAREAYTGRSSPSSRRQPRQTNAAPALPETYLQARDDYEGRPEGGPARTGSEEEDNPVHRLDEAVNWARWALWSSGDAAGARDYLLDERGVSRRTAKEYGLGYGLPVLDDVQAEVLPAAREAKLARESEYDDGYWWVWSGGIVYADPPVAPRVIQVRHRRPNAIEYVGKYQSWGRFEEPLGAWRVNAATDIIIVVEGLFDMLVFADEIDRRSLRRVVPVSMGGASPSYESIEWLIRQPAAKVIVPDPDEAGQDFVTRYHNAAESLDVDDEPYVAEPPDGLDPDEAVLDGWFPF